MIGGPSKRLYIIAFVIFAMVISFTMLPNRYRAGLFKKINSSSDEASTENDQPSSYSTEEKQVVNDENVALQLIDPELEIEVDAAPQGDSTQNKKNTPHINNVIPEGSDLL